MRFYHVTEFIRLKSKEEFINYAMIRGMEDGKRLHKAIKKQWEGKGYILEKQEVIYFFDLKTYKIIDGLLGTPDMWKIKGKTLNVIDHKSVNYPNPISKIDNFDYWNQIFLYAVMVLCNHSKKVETINLELWGYHKKQTIAESMPIVKKYKKTFTALTFLNEAINWMQKQAGKKFGIASSKRGYIHK